MLNGNILDNYNTDFDINNFVPHGACVIFNKSWIEQENILYVPFTFLFGEEELLYDYIKLKNHTLVFSNEIKVYHVGDATIGREISLKKIRNLYKINYKTSKLQYQLRRKKLVI